MAFITDENYFAKKLTDIGLADLDKGQDPTKLYYYNSVTKTTDPIIGLTCKFKQIDGVFLQKTQIDLRQWNYGIKNCISVYFYDEDTDMTFQYQSNVKSFKTLTLLNQLAYFAKHNGDNVYNIPLSIKAKPNEKKPKMLSLDIVEVSTKKSLGWLLSVEELTTRGVYKNMDEDDRAANLKLVMKELYDICDKVYNFEIPESKKPLETPPEIAAQQQSGVVVTSNLDDDDDVQF